MFGHVSNFVVKGNVIDPRILFQRIVNFLCVVIVHSLSSDKVKGMKSKSKMASNWSMHVLVSVYQNCTHKSR